MSFLNINFKRFDRKSDVTGFSYQSSTKPEDLDYPFNSISMDKPGFTQMCHVRNFMAESVLLGGNLRSSPQLIKSLRRDGSRPRDDVTNHVLITILTSESVPDPDPRKRVTQRRRVEIRIPGKMLNQGSVFVEELDCYLMIESMLDATRELIAKDASPQIGDSINIPESMVKQDPVVIYDKYKLLVESCLAHQDRINIRIGLDLRYGIIPPEIQSMHVAIKDSYFVPFTSYKFEYDPTLGEDEFIIENIHIASKGEFRSSFNQLTQAGVIYLDHGKHETLFGEFYDMAIFAGETQYRDYVFERKTQERFQDETLYVADRTGDPRLKEEIARLKRDHVLLKETCAEQVNQIINSKEQLKTLRLDLKNREETITRLRTNHDASMSTDAVLTELNNDRQRLANDSQKIQHDIRELKHKEESTKMAHKATMLKTISDMLKSSWGILTAILGGILSVVALCKKYNIKLTMSA